MTIGFGQVPQPYISGMFVDWLCNPKDDALPIQAGKDWMLSQTKEVELVWIHESLSVAVFQLFTHSVRIEVGDC